MSVTRKSLVLRGIDRPDNDSHHQDEDYQLDKDHENSRIMRAK